MIDFVGAPPSARLEVRAKSYRAEGGAPTGRK